MKTILKLYEDGKKQIGKDENSIEIAALQKSEKLPEKMKEAIDYLRACYKDDDQITTLLKNREIIFKGLQTYAKDGIENNLEVLSTYICIYNKCLEQSDIITLEECFFFHSNSKTTSNPVALYYCHMNQIDLEELESLYTVCSNVDSETNIEKLKENKSQIEKIGTMSRIRRNVDEKKVRILHPWTLK